ncbi:MAG: hypothetical protein ACYC5M_12085 [Anaerolineae bacterium]
MGHLEVYRRQDLRDILAEHVLLAREADQHAVEAVEAFLARDD